LIEGLLQSANARYPVDNRNLSPQDHLILNVLRGGFLGTMVCDHALAEALLGT
jgi:hypothetical protein